ncbi:DUF4402 domain-containing protein [Salinimicrobium sp. TIG7-5_MAKvit]|uniref:DUF4402 domain-containing protein n=1 Tax=Salinimicrobium sp. TIG7-5_MAKvit TaxID=3121289 RepID=UPI003C6E7ED5
MKKITLILFALITGTTFAQEEASATANAAAEIVSPIKISAQQDLNFGKVANNTAGTVVVATNSATTESTLDQIGSTTPSAAAFDVTAASGFSYKITMPESVSLSSGENNIVVNAFTNDAGNDVVGTGGIQAIGVGATLNVTEGQPTGEYSGTFDVTVAYE